MHFDSGPGAVPHGLHSLALGPYDLPNFSGRHEAPQHRLHRLQGLHMKSRTYMLCHVSFAGLHGTPGCRVRRLQRPALSEKMHHHGLAKGCLCKAARQRGLLGCIGAIPT